MHQNYQVPTIDPSLLDLRAYPSKACCPPSTTSASDDVAIAVGQASYDDLENSQMQVWGTSYDDLVVVGDSGTLAEYEGFEHSHLV